MKKYSVGYSKIKCPKSEHFGVMLSCLVLFNHVSSRVHFSGAAPYFSGKIDPAPLKKWPVRLWLSPVRRRGTHCRKVYATLPTVLLFLSVFSKHLSSRSTDVYSALDALARMRCSTNPRFTLHFTTFQGVDTESIRKWHALRWR